MSTDFGSVIVLMYFREKGYDFFSNSEFIQRLWNLKKCFSHLKKEKNLKDTAKN